MIPAPSLVRAKVVDEVRLWPDVIDAHAQLLADDLSQLLPHFLRKLVMPNRPIAPRRKRHAFGEITQRRERRWRINLRLPVKRIMPLKIEIARDRWPAMRVRLAHQLMNQRRRANLSPLDGQMPQQHATHAMK